MRLAQHVLLYCSAAGASDRGLRELAALQRQAGARLSVLVGVTDGPAARACCGIQGASWERLMDAHTDEQLRQVVDRLGELGCEATHSAVAAGASVAELAGGVAAEWGCDVVAVERRRRPWSSHGLPRGPAKALRRGVAQDVLEV